MHSDVTKAQKFTRTSTIEINAMYTKHTQKDVGEIVSAGKKWAKRGCLYTIKVRLEFIFNTVMMAQVIFQRLLIFTLCILPVMAESAEEKNVALGLGLSTTGITLTATYLLHPQVNLRGIYAAFSHDINKQLTNSVIIVLVSFSTFIFNKFNLVFFL